MDKESTKWIRFLGGKNLLYTLTILCLIAVSYTHLTLPTNSRV